MSAPHAQALVDGEATLKVRVIRKDGSEEHYDGDPVQIQIPAGLVTEYRDAIAHLRDVEARIIKHMNGE